MALYKAAGFIIGGLALIIDYPAKLLNLFTFDAIATFGFDALGVAPLIECMSLLYSRIVACF